MRVAIVTVSTRAAAGVYDDRSGDVLASAVDAAGHVVTDRVVIPDDPAKLDRTLRELVDRGVDLVLTSGGTGISPTDRTPEVTEGVCERMVPGVADAIRAASVGRVPGAMLSRAVAGVCHRTLIINLPGSPGGATDGWDVIAPVVEHAASQLAGGDHPRS